MEHVLEYKVTWGPGLVDLQAGKVTTKELEVRK